MSDLTWTNSTRKLSDLIPWENNPRQIGEADAARLAESLDQFGQIHAIAIGPGDEIYDGHQRGNVWAACDRYGPGYEVAVRVSSRALTQAEREKLVVYLHSGATGSWDWDSLSSWDAGTLKGWGLDEGQLRGWNDDAANLRTMLEAEAEDDGGNDEDVQPDDHFALYVPDALFPSNNEWDVPTLDIELQANFLELPLTKWGDGSRRATMRGTYHFYTEDYKFEALWKDPLNLVNSQCVAIIEANCSTNDQMPAAVALWGIYRKRWLARYLQQYGVKVWVDLNVDPKFVEINLLGVPKGWKAYATRGLDKFVDLLDGDYARAQEHAGCDPTFLVYGGGKQTEALCKDRGWHWLPENMHVKEGRTEANYG